MSTNPETTFSHIVNGDKTVTLNPKFKKPKTKSSLPTPSQTTINQPINRLQIYQYQKFILVVKKYRES